MENLSFFPGQKFTIFLEILNSDGYRTNSSTTPVVTRVFSFTSSDGYTLLDGYFGTDGYQQPLSKFATGMYYAKFTLPKGASSIGNYLIDVSYTNPINSFPASKLYQISVNAPFANFGIATTI